MPRRKGIPAYQLHRASGQARVRIEGKDHFLGRHGTEESKVKYEALVRALIDRRAKDELRARLEVATTLTVAELCASYLMFAKTYYVKNGLPTAEFGNILSSVRLLLDRHTHEFVTAFGPAKLMAIRDAWAAAGVVRNQTNHRVGRIRRMFKWGVSRELIPVEALDRLRTVEGLTYGRTSAAEGRKVLPVPDALVDAVRPIVSRQIWAMIELQRLTGMRPGEVTIIRTIDIDITGKLWVYTPSRHKTEHRNKDRRIYLGPRAIEALKPWLRLNVEEYLFQPRESMAELGVKRRSERKTKLPSKPQARRGQRAIKSPGNRYGVASYRRAIATACERLGIEPAWHPHQLRHSMAERLRQEFGEEHVKSVLGHASLNTAQMYGGRDQRRAVEAMERLG